LAAKKVAVDSATDVDWSWLSTAFSLAVGCALLDFRPTEQDYFTSSLLMVSSLATLVAFVQLTQAIALPYSLGTFKCYA